MRFRGESNPSGALPVELRLDLAFAPFVIEPRCIPYCQTNDRCQMTTFILIPGGWRGGWTFDPVADLLTASGHKVLALTLPGLGDVPAPAANLSSHIEAAVQVAEDCADELILVGHSYGGMVVSGVADRARAKIRALVYVDAYVPETGESVWSLTSPDFRDIFIAGSQADGLTCVPPSDREPRCRPHPMATFLQAIILTGQWRDVPRKVYVGAHGWEGSPFRDLHERLSNDPDWQTYALNCGHNVPQLEPEALAEILLKQA